MVTDGTNDSVGAKYYTLAGLPNYTEFTNLFDQYRIRELAVILTPQMTTSQVGSGSAGFNTNCLLWVDFDDVTTPANEAEALQRQNLQVLSVDQVHRFRFTPRIAGAVYSGAFTSYATVTPWIDCGSPNVEHYGWKWVIPSAAEILGYNIQVCATVEFRNPR